MSNRYHGHVRVSARNPRAASVCDRCGRAVNHHTLRWQYDWAGRVLQNKRILVCAHCEDQFQEQLRDRPLRPDPVPIRNARPEPFAPTGVGLEQTNFLTTDDGFMIAAEDGTLIVSEGSNTGN